MTQLPAMFTATDYSEMIEALRAIGHNEQDIEAAIATVEADKEGLSWLADYIEAMESGDDDEAFMCACTLGIA